jgi:type II secretory pathway pseudopilin PulG
MNVRSDAERGMTIIEIIISFGILMLVLSFMTLFFKQAFTHATLTTESMTNEQLARLAMSKINNSLSQASVDVASVDIHDGTPAPAILNQTATSIAFYRVNTLVPGAIGVDPDTQAPDPTYKVHIISYDGVGTINEYVTDWATYSASGPSPSPTALAINVSNFTITQVNSGSSTAEYQFELTLNNILNPTQAESPYTLVDNVDVLLKS